MTLLKNPSVMQPAERLAEIAEILAVGYRRLRAARSDCLDHVTPGVGSDRGARNQEESESTARNELDLLDAVEPSCNHAVNSREKGLVA